MPENHGCVNYIYAQLREAAYEFSSHGFQFDVSDLPSGRVWRYHYLWCCYAIVWGINQYDVVKHFAERPISALS